MPLGLALSEEMVSSSFYFSFKWIKKSTSHFGFYFVFPFLQVKDGNFFCASKFCFNAKVSKTILYLGVGKEKYGFVLLFYFFFFEGEGGAVTGVNSRIHTCFHTTK